MTLDLVAGEAYFVSDAEPINPVTWYRPIVEGLGYTWPRFHVPRPVAYAFAYLGEVVHYLGGPFPTVTRRGSAVDLSRRVVPRRQSTRSTSVTSREPARRRASQSSCTSFGRRTIVLKLHAMIKLIYLLWPRESMEPV